MGAAKNRGTPKWMVKINGKPYFLMDDLGGKPTIFGNTHIALDEWVAMILRDFLGSVVGSLQKKTIKQTVRQLQWAPQNW